MPFTFYNPPALTPGQMNPFNQAVSQALETYMKGTEAMYNPLKLQADAASKLAYAQLMGPQFTAKLLGNENILANLPKEQREAGVNQVIQAGLGGQMPGKPAQGAQGWFNDLLSYLTGGKTQQAPTQQPSQPQMQPQPQVVPAQNTQNIEQPVVQTPPSQTSQNTFSENVGTYKGIVEEGKEAGKYRAQDVKDLGEVIQNATNQQDTYDYLANLVTSPVFENMRRTPLAGKQELAYFSKEGNPQEQQLVGQFYTLTNDAIAKASRTFAGQFRKGEQALLEQMKLGPADTIDTAKGKLQALSVMNKMLLERSRLVSNLMEEKHISKTKAMDIANNQINGNQIRKNIYGQLNPTVTIRNKKTGEIMTVPIAQARRRGLDV